MLKRIQTGIVLLLIVILIFVLREISIYIFDAFIALIAVIATAEVSRVYNRCGKANFMNVAVYYAVFVFMLLMWGINAEFNFIQHLLLQAGLLTTMFIIAFSLSYFGVQKLNKNENYLASGLNRYDYSIKKALLTTFIMIYPALLISFLYLLNHIADLGFDLIETAYIAVDFGLFALLLTFIVTMFTDTFAYLVGSILKGPKLAPFISPGKTISGALGGLFAGTIISVIVFLICNADATFNLAFNQAEIYVWHFVLYGILASVISQVGDLFASKIKRNARAKDFSSIFPGHGGFMDRLDGISFNAVFTFVFVALIML